MRHATSEKATVTVGESTVTIKQPGRSTLIVANVLGSEQDANGQPCTLWLDRIVHRAGVDHDGWTATGAISTILQRHG